MDDSAPDSLTPCPGRSDRSLESLHWMSGIEIQIQFENIYAGFSKKPQITTNDMLLH